MEEEAIKPLPYLPGPLPFPSQDFQPPLNVDLPLSDQLLDERAWLHLNEMLSQSLGNLKLSPAITSVWLVSSPLFFAPLDLDLDQQCCTGCFTFPPVATDSFKRIS